MVLPDFEEIVRGAIVGVADIIQYFMRSESPWFEGIYGFGLINVIALHRRLRGRRHTGVLGHGDVVADLLVIRIMQFRPGPQ